MVTFEMDNPLINECGDNGYEKLLQLFLLISFRKDNIYFPVIMKIKYTNKNCYN